MPLDQPRRQRRAGQVDHLGAGGGDARFRSGRVDALAFDAYRPALVHRLAVEDPRRLEDGDRVVGFWPRALLRAGEGERAGGEDEGEGDASGQHAPHYS